MASRQSLVQILLPADPTAALETATKQYVDNKASATAPLGDAATAAAGSATALSRQDHQHPWANVKCLAAAVAGGGVSGITAETTFATLNLPAAPVAGNWFIIACVRADKTVASDEFRVNIKQDGGIIGAMVYGSGLLYGTMSFTGVATVSAAQAPVMTMTYIRSSGTGTGTIYADATVNRLNAFFVPS